MALTANEVNQLKTAGYTDAQIAVMTEREAKKKIEAMNKAAESAVSGNGGQSSGGTGFASWANGLFGAVGTLGSAGFDFGSAYVASKSGTQAATAGGSAASGTGFVPQILAPENRSNLIWIIVGGVVAVGLGVALYFGFRNNK